MALRALTREAVRQPLEEPSAQLEKSYVVGTPDDTEACLHKHLDKTLPDKPTTVGETAAGPKYYRTHSSLIPRNIQNTLKYSDHSPRR